jgi:hypothetical protein
MTREFGLKAYDSIFLEDYHAYAKIGTEVYSIETFHPQKGDTEITRFVCIKQSSFKREEGKRYVGTSWMEI